MSTHELPTFRVRQGTQYVEIFGEVDSQELAQEILATLPKALGLKARGLYTRDENDRPVTKGCLTGSADLRPTKGNTVNEAGLKRLARWQKDLGIVLS